MIWKVQIYHQHTVDNNGPYSKGQLSNQFCSWWASKFQCGLCNESHYGVCVRHFAVKSAEHIGISPLTNKRIQPRKDSAVCHHLLNCIYSPTFEDFNVLCNENNKYLLELKESFFMMRDRPSVNPNVRSAFLYQFKWVLVTLFAALRGLLQSVFYYFT